MKCYHIFHMYVNTYNVCIVKIYHSQWISLPFFIKLHEQISLYRHIVTFGLKPLYISYNLVYTCLNCILVKVFMKCSLSRFNYVVRVKNFDLDSNGFVMNDSQFVYWNKVPKEIIILNVHICMCINIYNEHNSGYHLYLNTRT